MRWTAVSAIKPPSRRQRRNPTRALAAVSAASSVPPAPKEWLAPTKAAWTALWECSVANLFDPSVLPALTRLFELRDRRERYTRALRRRPMVAGSQGQPVAHPLARLVPVLDAEIRQLEDRFGLNPRAQLALGLAFGEAQRTLADLNRDLDDDDGDVLTLLAEDDDASA